mgnify:FL=1
MLSASKTIVYPGSGCALRSKAGSDDVILILELEKDRARILLDCYGVIFHDLLRRETLGFRWKDVFEALTFYRVVIGLEPRSLAEASQLGPPTRE